MLCLWKILNCSLIKGLHMQKRGGINWPSREQLNWGLVIEFHDGCLPLGGLCVIWNRYLKFFPNRSFEFLKIYIFRCVLFIYTFISDKRKRNLRRRPWPNKKISRVSTGLGSFTRTEVGAGQRRMQKGSWGSELVEETSASYIPESPRAG